MTTKPTRLLLLLVCFCDFSLGYTASQISHYNCIMYVGHNVHRAMTRDNHRLRNAFQVSLIPKPGSQDKTSQYQRRRNGLKVFSFYNKMFLFYHLQRLSLSCVLFIGLRIRTCSVMYDQSFFFYACTVPYQLPNQIPGHK